jgi:hypothetical protein
MFAPKYVLFMFMLLPLSVWKIIRFDPLPKNPTPKRRNKPQKKARNCSNQKN